MSDLYTISDFIAKLQELADGYGDVPLTLQFKDLDIMWDVDDVDIESDEFVEDDGRIYITLK